MAESDQNDAAAPGDGGNPSPGWTRLRAGLASRFVLMSVAGWDAEMEAAVRDVGRFAGADVAYVVEIHGEGAAAEVTHAWWGEAPGPGAGAAVQRLEREAMPEAFDRLAAGETVRIDDVSLLEPGHWLTRRELTRRGVGAVLWQPLIVAGRVDGWLGCEVRGRPWSWSDTLVKRLGHVAALIARVVERKRADAQLAFHLDNIPLGMLQWDGNLRLQRWSPLATAMFGWTRDEVIGRPWSEIDFVHPDDAERVARTAHQLIHAERQSNTLINRNLTKDGRVLTCEWFNSALLDKRGRPVSFLSFTRDVTESQRMREELEAGRHELQRLNAGLEGRVRRRTAELERTKAASEEQARMLRVTLDASPEHVYLFDADGRCVFVSRAVHDDLGEVAASLVDRLPHESSYPPEIVHQFLDLWQNLRSGGGTQDAEVEIDTTRGRRRFDYTLTPVRGDDGRLQSAVLAAHDITDRAQTEAALREREVRYRALAEYATDMISRHSPDGRFTYVSPACHRLLGYDADELLGERPRILAHPDDRQKVIDSLPRLQTEGGVARTAFRGLRKDGSTVWLEAIGRQTDGEIVVVTRDISVRREVQARLRLIESAVEQVTDAVVVTGASVDPPGPGIVYVNPAFCAMTGYTAEEVIGRTPRILQGPGSERGVLDRVRAALEAGEAFSGETTNYRKDGTIYIVEWHINPLHDGDGRITHWVSIQRDVTERVQAEADARQHREEVAHVGRLLSLGQMASGVAHEINQPLTAISNYVNGCLRLLKQGRDRDEVIPAMDRVAEQVARVKAITGNLIGFGSRRPTRRDTHDLNELVRQALDLFDAEAKMRSIRVEFAATPGLPPLLADGIQVEQVLVNLARNAMDAVEEQPPERRRIEVRTLRDEPDHLLVEVHDSGECVTQDDIRDMFAPFYTTKAEGMGMGLTISQSIVDDHDGRLWARPRPEGGCVFAFRLPCADVERKETGLGVPDDAGKTPSPPTR